MTPLFKKLHYKGQSKVLILNAPQEFQNEMAAIGDYAEISDQLTDVMDMSFALIFVLNEDQIRPLGTELESKLRDDAVLWFAYPKKSSKKYASEINRDNGWQSLGDLGYEGVRQVAIDGDWSALRFRKAKHIKTMKRGFAMSEEGKKRTSGN